MKKVDFGRAREGGKTVFAQKKRNEKAKKFEKDLRKQMIRELEEEQKQKLR